MNKSCPVCGAEIKSGGTKAMAGNKEVTVCCDQCAKAVKENPSKYASGAAQ